MLRKVLLIWEQLELPIGQFAHFKEHLQGEEHRGLPTRPCRHCGGGYRRGALLTETIRVTGLDRVLSEALAPGQPFAIHDPANVILDLAVTLALGGDAISDIATARAEPPSTKPPR